MFEIKQNRHDPRRRFCVGTVPNLEDLPLALEQVSRYYALFLAVDATLINNEALGKTAKSLLERGCVYFCAWGPDCERVHDQFDLQRMPKEPKGMVVMTTWHSKESLSNALWFFASCAEPGEGFESECTDWVAVSVREEAWRQIIQKGLIGGRATRKFPPDDN
jgi:hypothetical protein